MITSQPTLQSNNALYLACRFKDEMRARIQKRKALGYCIKILLVIAIGAICWYLHPVPSFDKGEPQVQTQQRDRR